jgi:hypothetical protein
MITVIRMPAEQFAAIRRAAYKEFGPDTWEARFKAWLHHKHFILAGEANNIGIANLREGVTQWTNHPIARKSR